MNPEKPSREEIEAKLTALLLGELPAEEAQLLRWAISQDAALAQLHDRLKAHHWICPRSRRESGGNNSRANRAAQTFRRTPRKTARAFQDRRAEGICAARAAAEKTPGNFPAAGDGGGDCADCGAGGDVVAGVGLGQTQGVTRKYTRQIKFSMDNGKRKTKLRQPKFAPPATASQRRLNREAYFQNGNRLRGGYDWKRNQTTIVLPADGTDGAELAAATPAPSANFNLVWLLGIARGPKCLTVHMDNCRSSSGRCLRLCFAERCFRTGAKRQFARKLAAQAIFAARKLRRATTPQSPPPIAEIWLAVQAIVAVAAVDLVVERRAAAQVAVLPVVVVVAIILIS